MTVRSVAGTRASQHLDLIRGGAAVAVLIYHVRYRFFLDFEDLPTHDWLAWSWFGVTAFGHDAVMVFFVLSGFLIGSTVIRDMTTRRWNWREYLVSRGVRLYVVLIPGLLLTAAFDHVGLAWFGRAAIYTGAPQAYLHDFFDVRLREGVATLLGNLAFLQQILVRPFGSNYALWSLSFEFWYYVAFPLLALAALPGRSWIFRGVAALGVAAVLNFTGWMIAAYFSFWLLGVATALLPPARFLNRHPRAWSLSMATLGLGLVAYMHKASVKSLFHFSLVAIDAVTAVSFTFCLYCILHDRRAARGDTYGGLAKTLAGCSFTLYVVHLPILVLLRAWLVPDRPWVPQAGFLVAALGIAGLVFSIAWAVASLTEAHTGTIRRTVLSWRGMRDGEPLLR